ncbi:MAG: OmpA family protein [Oligoflexia bacterium]|nr:OmpA family protein [Oligoflexia bacterium]
MIRRFAMLAMLASLLSVAACAGKKPAEEQPDSAVPNAVDADENATGDSDSGKALGLQTVHFPYDSFALDAEGKTVLAANAQILKDKSSVKIQIEGHCDQRGGIQYNIALGEKRANAVKNHLVEQGIPADRITTISFGKERPLDAGATEEAYGKNRRANFVITSK